MTILNSKKMAFKNPWAKSDAVTSGSAENQWGKGGKFFNRFKDALTDAVESVTNSSVKYYSYRGEEWPQGVIDQYVENPGTSGVYVFDLIHRAGRNGDEDPNLPLFVANMVQLKAPDGTEISPVDFDHLGALICGEAGSMNEGFKFTGHMVQNFLELRYYASNTPGLPSNYVTKLRSSLGTVLSKLIGGNEWKSIAEYASDIGWKTKASHIRSACMKEAIAAVNRKPSQSGDGGLLQGLWHPDDPTRGAVQWKGSVDPIGPDNSTFPSRDAFEKFYDGLTEYNVKKWDTTGRFFYYSNNAGAVWEKYTDAWVDAMVLAAGGMPAYSEAQRRARGTF